MVSPKGTGWACEVCHIWKHHRHKPLAWNESPTYTSLKIGSPKPANRNRDLFQFMAVCAMARVKATHCNLKDSWPAAARHCYAGLGTRNTLRITKAENWPPDQAITDAVLPKVNTEKAATECEQLVAATCALPKTQQLRNGRLDSGSSACKRNSWLSNPVGCWTWTAHHGHTHTHTYRKITCLVLHHTWPPKQSSTTVSRCLNRIRTTCCAHLCHPTGSAAHLSFTCKSESSTRSHLLKTTSKTLGPCCESLPHPSDSDDSMNIPTNQVAVI